MPHVDYIGSDSKPWPSATELTNLLPQPWLWSWYKSSVRKSGWRGWQKCKAQSNRGMKIGSLVHSMLEAYITKVPAVPYDQKYGADRIADALYDKVNPLIETWISIEPHLKSEELKIHGTADAIVKLKEYPGLRVLDWKTAANKSETHAIQLACYSICWNEINPDKVNTGVIARVDKKSKKLTVHLDVYDNLEQYRPIVKALRTVWEYSQEKAD